jgi:hypothetical protein
MLTEPYTEGKKIAKKDDGFQPGRKARRIARSSLLCDGRDVPTDGLRVEQARPGNREPPREDEREYYGRRFRDAKPANRESGYLNAMYRWSRVPGKKTRAVPMQCRKAGPCEREAPNQRRYHKTPQDADQCIHRFDVLLSTGPAQPTTGCP